MTIWSVFRNQILLWLRFKGGYFYFCLAATVPVRVHTNFLGVNRKPSPKSESEKYGDNYLYAIIKVRNYLRAIEILKSSSVPSPEVSFTYVPLSLVFLVTASGKDDFALSYRMHQNFHSFLRCHCNFLWFKKLNFFLCTIMKKVMVTVRVHVKNFNNYNKFEMHPKFLKNFACNSNLL